MRQIKFDIFLLKAIMLFYDRDVIVQKMRQWKAKLIIKRLDLNMSFVNNNLIVIQYI